MKIWSAASEMAAVTPHERNRYVDFLRSVSILMVIIGHWLIATAHYQDGILLPGHLLESSPGTKWLTWVFQVMPIFFFVGGYANAVSLEGAKRKGSTYADWLAARLNRLVAPLLVLIIVWAIIAVTMHALNVGPAVIQYASQASLIPIWFLAIYIMVVVFAPLTYRFWTGLGFTSFFAFAAIALTVDYLYFAADITWLGWSNFFWVWFAVHQLGYAWRDDRLPGTLSLFVCSALGFITLLMLTIYGPYPLAMVGSPNEGLSNTSPPKVTMIVLAIFQFGLLMAIEAPMRRVLNNARLWAATVLVNSMIMTVYLWHITAMVIFVALLYLADGFGLGIAPGSKLWWVSRPAWIAVLFVALLPIAILLSPLERHARRAGAKIPSATRQVLGAMLICLGVAILALYGYAGGPFPRLDLAAFSMVIIGAGVSGLLPTVVVPKFTLSDLRVLGIWLLGAVVVYSAYTYVRINNNVTDAQAACFDSLGQKFTNNVLPEQLFQQEYGRLQILVERSLVARAKMLDIWNRLRVNDDLPIASRDLATLKLGSENYLAIRGELYELAQAYECGVSADEATLAKYDIESELRLKGVMLSLSAALTLFDNYMLGIALFEQDDRLRQIINDPDSGFGIVANNLAEATLAAYSIEKRRRARAAIEFYETHKPSVEQVDEDSAFAYLEQLIESSPSYNYVKKVRIGDIAVSKFGALGRITEDLISAAGTEGLDIVSSLFGNTIGLYESRKGKMFGDEAARKKIESVLQPLDILLEKTPFRLTDKLIPGHFGHVAIWTGTKAEMIEVGVWEEPVVQKYSSHLSDDTDPNSRARQQIIEALRNGVQLSTLEQFLNVDDFAILRPIFPSDSTGKLKREALLLAFRQLGKQYDFNFDVNTTDKIVCSELAYVSFPTIDWPTEKTLGRHSISPDNVAQLAWDDFPLELVMFYHNGELVAPTAQRTTLKTLMSR